MSVFQFIKKYKTSFLVFFTAFFLSIVILQFLTKKEDLKLYKTIELDGQLIVDQIKLKLLENEKVLIRMTKKVQLYHGDYNEKKWMLDANNVVDDLHGALGLRKADIDHKIVWVSPKPKEGEMIKGLSLMEEKYKKEVIARSMKTKKIEASHSMELHSGIKGFIVVSPLYYKGEFQGHFIIGYDIKALFDSMLNVTNKRDFIFKVIEEGNVIYSSSLKTDLAGEEYSMFYDVQNNTYNWEIEIIPTKEYLYERKDELYLQIGLALLSSFFIGFIFYLLQIQKEKDKVSLELQKLNHSLELAVAEKTEYLQKILRETEELNDDLEESNHLLKREQALYNIVYNSSLDGISILDLTHHTFIDCNERLLEMLSLQSKQEIYSKIASDFSPILQFDGQLSIDKASLFIAEAKEKGTCFFEWRCKKNNGEEFWAEISLIYIKLFNEELIYTIWRDIDEKKKSQIQIERTNQQLQEFNERLEEKVKEKTKELEENFQNLKNTQAQLAQSEKMASLGNMVAGVSHEINTPIGIALTASTHAKKELLTLEESYRQERMSEEEFLEYLEDMKLANESIYNNLNKAVNLIKSFKQVAVDQTSDSIREFHFKEYLEEVLLSLHNQMKKTKIEIKLDIDSSLTLNSNPGAFSQIFTNLILNSLIHGFNNGQDKGAIVIAASLDNGRLQIIYDDNGKGITKETKNKIFDPFYTTNRAKGGSGLGMNIVYNLVTQKLKGHIRVEDKEQKGIRFIIDMNV